MARFLFVVPPFTGHVNPTVPVAKVLAQRGHEVAWCGLPGTVDHLLPPGAVFLPATSQEVADHVAAAGERRPDLRGAAAFKFLQEEVLLPLAGAMVDGVDAAVDRFGPDVLVVDQQALAGAVVARRRGLVWATSASTSGELVDPLDGLPLASSVGGDPTPNKTLTYAPADPSVTTISDSASNRSPLWASRRSASAVRSSGTPSKRV